MVAVPKGTKATRDRREGESKEGKTPAVIDLKVLRHVAEIARLNLTLDEERVLGNEFAQILSAFSLIADAPVQKSEPKLHPLPIPGRLREDVHGVCLTQQEALANATRASSTSSAKNVKDGYFKAPLVR